MDFVACGRIRIESLEDFRLGFKDFFNSRYINCTAFGLASKAFIRKLQETLGTYRPAEKLTEYRHLWVDLSHMMQQLGICV
jgi:hypothetical protein